MHRCMTAAYARASRIWPTARLKGSSRAEAAQDPAGNYSGERYATTGTYFGSPRNPAQLTEAMTITGTDDPQNNGVVCTIEGALTQFGRIYRMANAQFTCKEPGAATGETTTVAIESLHPTGQGIEFRLNGPTGDGCTSAVHFAAVLNN